MTLSDKRKFFPFKTEDGETSIVGEQYYYEKDVKEFIRSRYKHISKLLAEEIDTHKNHRVQAILMRLRIDLLKEAGDKLVEQGQK